MTTYERSQFVIIARRRGPLFAALLCLTLLGLGCAEGYPSSDALESVRRDSWQFAGHAGTALVSDHYVIHTTIDDRALNAALSRVMEGALSEYQSLAPDVPLTRRAMDCYVLADRAQWAQFTRERTGDDASIYLHISRGGYTVRDWFVAYYIGDGPTLSVAAHEGFHQFAARYFKTRIPPALEEGIACMFEGLQWEHGHPRWDLHSNPSRESALHLAASAGRLIPVGDLISLHAGQIVNRPTADIAAFYAESWALAVFLWEGADGVYRPLLREMLADAAAGRLHGGSHPGNAIFWNPASAKPLFEAYFRVDLPTLDHQFRAYVHERLRD